MSALTGNQIKNTYQGLLKLADSSTGITQNLQAVEDGLGNNTGLMIAEGQLESHNIPSQISLKARYYGTGYALTNAAAYGSGTQNLIISQPFYDNANYSYSAISFYTATATSTSDTVELAIYTGQLINPNGLFPHTPIVSGITADTTTQGQKTYVFPSNISMSGYGAGWYFLVFKITNSGVAPTWRPGQGFLTGNLGAQQILGNAQTFNNSFNNSALRFNNSGQSFQVFSGTTTFDNPYSSTLNTTQSSTTNFTGNLVGFVLHTVDA